MSRNLRPTLLALACLVLAGPSLAQDRASTSSNATPTRAATSATTAAAKPKAKASASRKAAGPKAASTKAAAPAGRRTLGDIHIEGEVPVPQVLFVTARDQRRVVDFGHRRYLRTSRELASTTTLPVRLTAPTPTAARAPAPARVAAPSAPETP